MKLFDVLVTVLLAATTAAAAAVPSVSEGQITGAMCASANKQQLSGFLATTSALVNTSFSESAASNSTMQKAKNSWGFLEGWGFMCVKPSKDTITTTYDDYWHSMNIFCKYLADNEIKFEYDQVFDAADSLCNDERCFSVSAKNVCHDPEHRIVTWDECIAAFQHPYYQKAMATYHGPCTLPGKRVAGASVKEPSRCWIFSCQVHAPLLQW